MSSHTLGFAQTLLRQARHSRLPVRLASTVAATVKIPPESPRFIDIPRPPQQQGIPKLDIKGVLPLPREIFLRRGKDKTSEDYVLSVMPERTRPERKGEIPSEEVKDRLDWQSRMSAMRRRNLHDGLAELHDRKRKTERRTAAQSAYKQAEYERKVHAPIREDERLTNPTIVEPKYKFLARSPPPWQSKRRTYRKLQAAKVEDRRNDLHTLYINARSFIIDEAGLDRKIDEVFDAPFYKANPTASIWDEQDIPETIQGILNQGNRKGVSAIGARTGHTPVTKERLHRIAEELTGGKM